MEKKQPEKHGKNGKCGGIDHDLGCKPRVTAIASTEGVGGGSTGTGENYQKGCKNDTPEAERYDNAQHYRRDQDTLGENAAYDHSGQAPVGGEGKRTSQGNQTQGGCNGFDIGDGGLEKNRKAEPKYFAGKTCQSSYQKWGAEHIDDEFCRFDFFSLKIYMFKYHQRINQRGSAGQKNGIDSHAAITEQVADQGNSQHGQISVAYTVDYCGNILPAAGHQPGNQPKRNQEGAQNGKLHKNRGVWMELPGEIRIVDIAEQHYRHKNFKAQLVYGIEPGFGYEFDAPEPVSEKHQQKKWKNSVKTKQKIIHMLPPSIHDLQLLRAAAAPYVLRYHCRDPRPV